MGGEFFTDFPTRWPYRFTEIRTLE